MYSVKFGQYDPVLFLRKGYKIGYKIIEQNTVFNEIILLTI